MAPLSSDVSAGDDVLASQYNNLRTDVLDPVVGHNHTGKPGEGVAMPGALRITLASLIGDGSDGDLIVNAPTTIATLKRFDNLTLNDELKPAPGQNFLFIQVKGILTINSGGKLTADGFGGAGGAAGNPPIDGGDGFISGMTSVPNPDLAGQNGIPATDGLKSFQQLAATLDDSNDIFVGFGAGGGGGFTGGPGVGGVGADGGDIWAGGGGGGDKAADSDASTPGGNGGGCLVILADTIIINAGGEITARGINAADAGANGGGGGGGGGGLVYVAASNLTNNGLISAIGGTGGIGTGGGGDGGDGADGLVVEKLIPG